MSKFIEIRIELNDEIDDIAASTLGEIIKDEIYNNSEGDNDIKDVTYEIIEVKVSKCSHDPNDCEVDYCLFPYCNFKES